MGITATQLSISIGACRSDGFKHLLYKIYQKNPVTSYCTLVNWGVVKLVVSCGQGGCKKHRFLCLPCP